MANQEQLVRFPSTRYMGSKYKLLPYINEIIRERKPKTFLDAFSGSACVGYAAKTQNVSTTTNDFLKFAYHIANASIANSKVQLTAEDVEILISGNEYGFISKTFEGLYFSDEDNNFLDALHLNIKKLDNPAKQSIAYAAASRAMIKRRPRGIFAYVGNRYDDGRRDLQIDLRRHFIKAVSEWNAAVFDNGLTNEAYNLDIFDVSRTDYDMVYIDPPYLSKSSDNDYTRRYHLIEGFVDYWATYSIQEHTKTKKIRSLSSRFSSKSQIYQAFDDLFYKFKDSTLVVSYSSNSVPEKEEMISLLSKYKHDINVAEINYKYTFGTHAHKVGNNNNDVSEYIFLAE